MIKSKFCQKAKWFDNNINELTITNREMLHISSFLNHTHTHVQYKYQFLPFIYYEYCSQDLLSSFIHVWCHRTNVQLWIGINIYLLRFSYLDNINHIKLTQITILWRKIFVARFDQRKLVKYKTVLNRKLVFILLTVAVGQLITSGQQQQSKD